MNKFLAVLLAIFFFSFSTSQVYAGGGPVAIYAFPLRPFDQTKTFIVEVETTTSEPCDKIKPSITFKDVAVESDSITPFTPPDDGTYITRHYNTGQPNFVWKELCITYVQVKSGLAEQRTIQANILVNGQKQERTVAISFGNDPYSKQLQDFGRANDYDNTPVPDVISEQYLGEGRRGVSLQWQKIPWATTYAVFGQEMKEFNSEIKDPLSLLTMATTQTQLKLSASSFYYLKVIACKTAESCKTSSVSPGGYGFVLSKMFNINSPPQSYIAPITPAYKVTSVQTNPEEVQPMVIPTTIEDKKVEELNKKVAQLEGKLEESNKKQSVLEQRINELIAFIKRVLPFVN